MSGWWRRAFATGATNLAVAGCSFVASVVTGCSSAGGSAIRTGPIQLPSYAGPVAVYSSGRAPPGAVDLGVVEVHASQQEATIDVLLPQFVAKVAQIGGDIAVVDGIRARFEVIGRMHVENYYYMCGRGVTCGGTRTYAANEEIMTVSVFGHAFSSHVVPKGEQPLIPPSPSPNPAPAPAPAPGLPSPIPNGTGDL